MLAASFIGDNKQALIVARYIESQTRHLTNAIHTRLLSLEAGLKMKITANLYCIYHHKNTREARVRPAISASWDRPAISASWDRPLFGPR